MIAVFVLDCIYVDELYVCDNVVGNNIGIEYNK